MRYCYSLLALFVLAAVPAQAQYLKLGDIKGESTLRGYEDWIELQSFSHRLTVQMNAAGGGGGTATAVHDPIVIRKELGIGSVPIIELLNTGGITKDAELAFVRLRETGFEYLKIELENVVVLDYSLDIYGGNETLETVALAYEKITWTYTPQRADGSAGTPIVTSYNVTTNTSLVASLSAFEATTEGDEAVFRWQTTGESGIYGFELQRWEDGAFRRASYVPGAGWSSKNLEYELRVRGLEKGIHTFRLAVLGVDGAVSYSKEVEVAVGVPAGADVVAAAYPNPFTDAVRVAVAVARPREARITVSDLLGREVAVVFDGLLEPGGERVFDVAALRSLAAGLYAVRVVSEGRTTTRMVTKAE